jgi:hypothetical protein
MSLHKVARQVLKVVVENPVVSVVVGVVVVVLVVLLVSVPQVKADTLEPLAGSSNTLSLSLLPYEELGLEAPLGLTQKNLLDQRDDLGLLPAGFEPLTALNALSLSLLPYEELGLEAPLGLTQKNLLDQRDDLGLNLPADLGTPFANNLDLGLTLGMETPQPALRAETLLNHNTLLLG